jgi:hypothetical protein
MVYIYVEYFAKFVNILVRLISYMMTANDEKQLTHPFSHQRGQTLNIKKKNKMVSYPTRVLMP